MSLPLRLGHDDVARLNPYGTFSQTGSATKFLDPTIKDRGFHGQAFNGTEILPADLTRLTLDVQGRGLHGSVAVTLEGTWTLDRLWRAGQAVASYAIDLAHGDETVMAQSRAVLTELGLHPVEPLTRTPDTIGVPTSWEIDVTDVCGGDIHAILGLF